MVRIRLGGPGGRRYAIDPAAQPYLLVGDETALPAIGTLLDALPAGARADVYVEQERLVTRGYWKRGEANYPDHDYGED